MTFPKNEHLKLYLFFHQYMDLRINRSHFCIVPTGITTTSCEDLIKGTKFIIDGFLRFDFLFLSINVVILNIQSKYDFPYRS